MKDKNNVAFYYGVNMLRMLLQMKLIMVEEYKRIVKLQKEHYEVKISI